MHKAALSGIKVLDVSTVLAAPVAATLLGDFGAEVVKIEEPDRGDFTRLSVNGMGGRSLQWVQEGRNKQSVTVNLRSEAGQQLVRDLIPNFDVVILNYRPATLLKWGLDPERLQTLNPQAIILSVTGYGLSGPYKDRGAFDRIASAFSGLTYVSGESDGDPVRSGYSVIDFMGAYLSAFAVTTALYHRDVLGGDGQIIDMALYEAGFRASENALLEYSASGQIRERMGNKNPYIVPATDFQAGDQRRVSIHAGTDTLFRKLASVIGQPDLADDPRFSTAMARITYQEELYEIVSEWVASHPADSISTWLNEADIPASPVMSIADIAHNEHFLERGTIVNVQDEEHGELQMVAPLPKLSGTPGRIRALGEALGASTERVLQHYLHLSAEDIQKLRNDQTI